MAALNERKTNELMEEIKGAISFLCNSGAGKVEGRALVYEVGDQIRIDLSSDTVFDLQIQDS